VEIQATVRYAVADPRVYLFEVQDLEGILRAATESVLREAVAGQPFQDLLTVHREQFQANVLDRLGRRCAEYGDHGLGIRLDGLSLHDLHPPQEVVQAYHDVARAMEARDRLINEARAEAVRKHRSAEAQALQTVRQAQSSAHETVSQATAARDTFLARLRARNGLSLEEEWRLFSEAAEVYAQGGDLTAAYEDYERRRRDRIAVQVFLTDFRLSWEAIVRALGGRDKILVDTDKLPGRRHLMLFDPETFRPPPPMMFPPERGPRAPRSDEGL
jgi:regulator of protease activity HflC (stomatin/prohibitin superfamily)